MRTSIYGIHRDVLMIQLGTHTRIDLGLALVHTKGPKRHALDA